MKRKLIFLNKLRLTKQLKQARVNGCSLELWRLLLVQLQVSNIYAKANRKNLITYNFDEAEFDEVLGWLMVPELIKGVSLSCCGIRIFTRLIDLPKNEQIRFQHLNFHII